VSCEVGEIPDETVKRVETQDVLTRGIKDARMCVQCPKVSDGEVNNGMVWRCTRSYTRCCIDVLMDDLACLVASYS